MMSRTNTGKMQLMDLFHEHADRIVIMGCSCVGKTTMAQQIQERPYVCFDALYPWHHIETLGLSLSAAMSHVRDQCEQFPTFVLDGWNLCDVEGEYFPEDVCVYVLYASYQQVVSQYRVPVDFYEQHRHMFDKWYGIPYENYPNVRYFENNWGSFRECFIDDFRHFLST